ncbi:MAG: beta-lactamase domain protein [Acidobacteria bacterium]|nr:beta-lactamase domain protein [Acidobacteriota bacterium]
MVNVYFVRDRVSGGWVLVDTGMHGYTNIIRRTAARLFRRPPQAILLTHGHFDHVGTVAQLAEAWAVPVYAHPLELPYLTGRSKYPPPDPTVGGGAQAWMSPLYSRGPIDLGARVTELPINGVVPWLPEWKWLLTAGHAPGHVSFFRDTDRVMIAGDAVVTTRQESLFNVLLQRRVVSRPPAYFTPDWDTAGRSVRTIAALEPNVLATGHGQAMRGSSMRRELHDLADRFEDAIPSTGRYVDRPAVMDRDGLVHVPPARSFASTPAGIAAIGLGAAVGIGLMARARSRG